MAAAGDPVGKLCEEATCPICLEYFADPVTIAECGHNFCRACLAPCWGESGGEASCPQCRGRARQANLIPNRHLANVVELTKQLRLQGGERAAGKGRVCEKHQEPLKLFCKDDEAPICLVCDRSKEHANHEVIPVEEAAPKYKEDICSYLEILKTYREQILENKADTETESQVLLIHTRAEREKTVAEFRRLHQFLEEQEKRLLAQMEELEKEIPRQRDEHLARLSEKLSSLERIIQEMEEKCQQPPSEFLQDIKSTLKRYDEKQKKPAVLGMGQFSPVLKWKTWEFCDITPFLEGLRKQFKGMLVSGLQLQKANVTLDPETAHPQLFLSEDRKRVKMRIKCEERPTNPERFDHYFFVLGCEGFSAGRHFWDVIVGNSEDWAVGVARKSVRRKGKFQCGAESGIWAAGKCTGEHRVPDFTNLSENVKRVRVSLNCAGGRVAFYDADTAALLSAFSAASFSGETLIPFFYLGKKGNCSAPFSGFFNPHLTIAP